MEKIIKTADIVSVTTRAPEDSSKSSNGGDYWFYTEYFPVDGGLFEAHHRTSADFEFCGRLDEFRSCRDCENHDGSRCYEQYQRISLADLAALIQGKPWDFRAGYNNPDLRVLEVDASR